MTIKEALENAVAFLESLGYTDGDIHNDLAMAIGCLRIKAPTLIKERID